MDQKSLANPKKSPEKDYQPLKSPEAQAKRFGPISFFMPHVDLFREYDKALKIKSTIVILYILLVSSLYFIFRFHRFYSGPNLSSGICAAIFVFSILLLWLLKFNFNNRLIFSLTAFTFISLNMLLMYHNGNGMQTGLLWSFVITVGSIFLMGPLWGGLIALINLGGVSALYWLDRQKYDFPHLGSYHNEDTVLLNFVIFLSFLTGILTWLYELSRNNATLREKVRNQMLEKLIAQKQAAEDGLLEANNRLQSINENLEETITRETEKALQQERFFSQQSKLAAMGEMLGAIAHQWRQPLNSLAILIQDILEAYDARQLDRNYLSNAVKSSMDNIRHMSQTVDDFRNFIRPSNERVSFDIKGAIREALKISSAQFAAHDISIELMNLETPEPANVFGFPSEFKQVVLNLVNNSKDAIEEYRIKTKQPDYKGKIVLKMECKEHIRIIFEDNGGGILPEYLERIFEPYFTTKDPAQGTGIGLYLSKKIIEEKMSGWIFVGNIEKGVRFTLIFNKE